MTNNYYQHQNSIPMVPSQNLIESEYQNSFHQQQYQVYGGIMQEEILGQHHFQNESQGMMMTQVNRRSKLLKKL